MRNFTAVLLTLLIVLSLGLAPAAIADTASTEIVLYSGRSKSLVEPIVKQFEKETGIKVTARYGNTAQLVMAIQEEGDRSPADVFWAQDAGALGALSSAGALQRLPGPIVRSVPEKFRNSDETWVATSGRARTLAYSPERVKRADLPGSVFDLADPKWKGRIGWAPSNASFQAFVTAMVLQHGEAKTKEWLIAVKNNGAKAYPKNTPIIEAIAAGEIDLGLPNHYYLLRFKAANASYPVEQTFFDAQDVGNLINVAGVGVLKTTKKRLAALEFIEYLLAPRAQQYFTSQVFEYPISDFVIPNARLVSFDELMNRVPPINYEQLNNLEGTLKLLSEVGLL